MTTFLFANDAVILNGNHVIEKFTQEPKAIPIPILDTTLVPDKNDCLFIQNCWTCYFQLREVLQKAARKEDRPFVELYGEKIGETWDLELVIFSDCLCSTPISFKGQDLYKIYENAALLFSPCHPGCSQIKTSSSPCHPARILSALSWLIKKWHEKKNEA